MIRVGSSDSASSRPPRGHESAPSAVSGRGYLTIALVACTVLMYQVAITRVLSVVLWYHFAFLSISLAMLGVGVPGVWYSLRRPGERSLGRVLVAAAVAVPASIVAIIKLGGMLPRGFGTVDGLASLFPAGVLLIVIVVLVPLVCMGAAVCLLLIAASGRDIGRMYGADLLGATAGALLVVPLLHLVPTPLLIAASGLLPLLGAVLVRGVRPAAVGAVLVLVVGSIAWGTPYRLSYSKVYWEESDAILVERWTPTARLTVFPAPFFADRPEMGFGWGMGSKYVPRPIRQLWLEQDGAAGTPISELRSSPAELEHLDFDVTSVGYQLRPPQRACVIGAGGGRDVLTALRAGAREVDAVELNPAIIDIVSNTFGEFSGDVYHLPGVEAYAEEGRSFLTRSEGGYDALQISLIDSWSATTAGAFALSENYLYTREAFRLYWERLSDDGLLSVSRWFRGERQLEGARLVLLAQATLADLGVADPGRHIAIVEADALMTLLVSRRPFDDAELARLDEIAHERGFVRHWPLHPGTPPMSLLVGVLQAGSDVIEKHGLDISPPEDDRPFFFQTVPLLGDVDPMVVQLSSPNEHSVLILRWLLGLLSVLTVLLFFLPFVLSRRLDRRAEFWRGSGYFLAIGLAFMLVEAGWIQRFILYLGHPSYATTVVIATILLGAGAGSIVAARTSIAAIQRYAPVLPVVLAGVNLALGPLFHATLGASFVLRILISIVLLVPTGFLMGFAFPSGMIRFGDGNKAWFWALNGAASVVATVFSLALAMGVGFPNVIFLGVGVYLVAALLLRGQGGQASSPV